ncbi:hypothetical protein POM88_031088 [Heracleum sosnowskyi]|uniref:Uncharacterized protein n=1 Tax=Heracleum sosnowskyi TaxID=360622 RepID=A0AAD8MGB4_9APIA|nr:hypothetical protein POM88_031088 [Heracleum sosnowskyi]
MHFNIDLRFVLPVLINLIKYISGQANQVSSWDYFITTDQNGWLYITLAFVLLVFAISIKLTISITVSAEPIMLRFGDFDLSVPLVFLMIASVLFPPQILLYAYLICTCIWISPFPSHVFEKIMNWLQQIPVFIITTTQLQSDDLQAPVYQYFEVDHDQENDENIEINVIFGHA